jgi:hypothetical protein
MASDEIGLLEVLVSPPSQQLAQPSNETSSHFNSMGSQPTEMQKNDPLFTQIWRLYSKTKERLPNHERMENLTWRMMAMSLRKRRQEEEISLRSGFPDPHRDI